MPPYSTPSPKTLQHTKEGRKITKCDLHPNPLKSLECGNETSLWKSWIDLPEALKSSNGLFIVAVSFVHYQTFCLLARCTWDSGRPARDYREIWTSVKTSKKKRLRRGERQQLAVWHRSLDHTDHRGHSHEKHSPLHVFNKCHLTLGEALAVSLALEEWGLALDLGSWRRLSPHWQEASGISWLFACPGAFPLPHQTFFFFPVAQVAFIWFTKTFTYFLTVYICDLCAWGGGRGGIKE